MSRALVEAAREFQVHITAGTARPDDSISLLFYRFMEVVADFTHKQLGLGWVTEDPSPPSNVLSSTIYIRASATPPPEFPRTDYGFAVVVTIKDPMVVLVELLSDKGSPIKRFKVKAETSAKQLAEHVAEIILSEAEWLR